MSYEAVIFDLDGTLIDSNWIWPKVTGIYLDKYDVKVPNGFGPQLEGKSFTEIATYFKEFFNLPFSVEEIKEEWNNLGETFYVHEAPLRQGAADFLELLSIRSIKRGIATSNSIEMTEQTLKTLRIKHYFDEIATSCMVQEGKPHPDIYLEVARRLGVVPHKCLVLEDSYNGALAAKRAGMTVWIMEESKNPEKIKALKEIADQYFIDYEECLEYFNKKQGS